MYVCLRDTYICIILAFIENSKSQNAIEINEK